jgi:tetratricopeptide (TPR) repeat protein
MGMRDLAEPELQEAVALSPLSVHARNTLGQLLLDTGRAGEAEEQFRASVRAEPNALAYDNLGAISMGRGAPAEAERDFRAALSVGEDDSYAHLRLGDIYKAAGRRAEALKQYQAGLVKDPTNSQALAAVQELRQQSAAPP